MSYLFILPKESEDLKINKSETKIEAYGGAPVKTKGLATLTGICRNQIRNIEFIISEEGTVPILGLGTCSDLNLVKKVNTMEKISKTVVSREEFLKENKNSFEGLGEFIKNFHIGLKENVTPVVKPARRIPLH